jgi:hypothetical protein
MLSTGDLALHEFGLYGGNFIKTASRRNPSSVLEADFQALFGEGEHLLRERCRFHTGCSRPTCRVKQKAKRLFSVVDGPFRRADATPRELRTSVQSLSRS